MKRVKITREGKRFLIASFLIAVAAVNTGNNLIYLMLSLMLSFLVLAVVLPKVNLSRLSVVVFHPTPLFAGEEAIVRVLMTNSKRRISAYSVNCIVPGAAAPAYFGLIRPLGNEGKDIRVQFQRRGLYRYSDFQLRSGFPFVLLSLSRAMSVTGEVLVYPRLRDVVGMAGGSGSEVGELSRLVDSGDDLHSLREFRYGDDWRKIHWKASARTGDLYVKEYAEQGSAKVTIVLDNLLPEEGELFERAVSFAGSFSRYFIERGYFVRVVSSRKIIPFGKGEEHLFKILDILAVIREEESWDSPVQDAREGLFLTILKSRQRPNPYAATGAVKYADDL